jgi:hypothetical protein
MVFLRTADDLLLKLFLHSGLYTQMRDIRKIYLAHDDVLGP